MPTPTKTPAPAVSKSDDPVKMLTHIIGIIDDLTDVMLKEEVLIQARKSKEHAELLKHKQRLTIDYRTSIKTIALQPDIMKSVPQELRQSARVAARKLADISDRNSRFLKGAISAGEKLAETVFRILREEFLPKNSYANPQVAAFALGNYSPTCKPVTLNRRV